MYASTLLRRCARGVSSTTHTESAAAAAAASAAPPLSLRIAHAALLRRRALQLGDYKSGYPTSLPLLGSAFASATPYCTNMYILAHGEAEGLARGERLERYGARIQLVRACAAGDVRGMTRPTRTSNNNSSSSSSNDGSDDGDKHGSSINNNNKDEHGCHAAVLMPILEDITRQLNSIDALQQQQQQKQKQRDGGTRSANSATDTSTATATPLWYLRRVPCLAAATTTHDKKKDSDEKNKSSSDGAAGAAAAVAPMSYVCDVNSNAEVVVAEWRKRTAASDGDEDGGGSGGGGSNTQRTDDVANELLMENGIGFSCIGATGLRAMRAARMAFLARVEALAASLADEQQQRQQQQQQQYEYSGSNGAAAAAATRGGGRGSSHVGSDRNGSSVGHRYGHDAVLARGEAARTLSILDVSEADYTCSHMVTQAMVEQGTQTQPRYQLTFVPLTDRAARSAQRYADARRQPRQRPEEDEDGSRNNSSSRDGSNNNNKGGSSGGGNVHTAANTTMTRLIMSQSPCAALAQPFELLPLRSFDVAAYTAYIDLTLPSGRCIVSKNTHDDYDMDDNSGSSSSNNSSSSSSSHARAREWGSSRRGIAAATTTVDYTQHQQQHCRLRRYADARLARVARSDDVARLAMALAMLRRGGAMLVTLLPTPVSTAALCDELCTQREMHVAVEAALLRDARRIVAEAIARTGRWSVLTDEILPTVDAPQGSAVSLMVVMD